MKRIGILLLIAMTTIGCRKSREAPPEEAAKTESHPASITNWTAKTELFMEYPPLVVGETSRFAVHLTRLDTFKPLAKGTVEVRLAGDDRRSESFKVDGPSRNVLKKAFFRAAC